MPVYFIQDEHTLRVKIGFSQDPLQRLRQLQTGNGHRLAIVRVLDGRVGQEKALHRRYEAFRRQGEWFALPDAVLHEDTGLPELPIPSPPPKAPKESRPKPPPKLTRKGEAAMTGAEKQAKQRALYHTYKGALLRVLGSGSLGEAKRIALDADAARNLTLPALLERTGS